MDNAIVDQKQISTEERAQISRQVNAELVEHLYKGCLPGTIAGIPIGFVVFFNFYHQAPTSHLIAWTLYYSFALLNLGVVYFFYQKYKNQVEVKNWLLVYSGAMCLCAIAWGMSVLLIPDNMTRQYIAFFFLLMFATGYTTGTIGVFELCVVTISLILVPLMIWCFHRGGFLYNTIAAFTIIFYAFLIGINRRSTEWFKDSLKLKLENNLVSYQANHDVLTNLPNQRMLPQFVDAAIASIANTKNTFALVSFSLNRMEMIDDSLGHQASNELIQVVSGRLNELAANAAKMKESQARYIITISRKDTFNILITPVLEDQIESKVKALFSILEEPFYLSQKGVKMTASIGVAIYGQDGNDAGSLLVSADAASLQAKAFGGNRLEFYRAEINAQLPKLVELETDLHEALKQNQFQLYYQPLVDVKSNRISGMEALIRWFHPKHGFISPMNFIPLAEETGLIIPLGEWILREAVKQTRIWHEMGFDSLRVAVNLSAKQLRQENLIEIIKETLKTTNLDPKFLEMEITETAILDESVIHVIKEFKNMGLSLAVDDFGTGYSGLSYLKRFAVDKLKIDQSFIKDIPTNNDSITIVSAIIAMGRELKVKILAEGVETDDQLNFLQTKGCDFIQGYYYSKPLEPKFFTQLLISHQGLAVPSNTK